MGLRMDANRGVICESLVWSGKNVANVVQICELLFYFIRTTFLLSCSP